MKREINFWLILIIVLLVCALSVFGIIVIGSATHITVNCPSSVYTNQKIWLALGLVLLTLVAAIDYHFILKFYIPIYLFNLLLLIIVLFVDKGEQPTARWLYIGPFGVQPSEFSKIFLILFLARVIDLRKDKINEILQLLLVVSLNLVPLTLIYIQPALSAALVNLVILLVALFVAKLSYKYIVAALVVILPVGFLCYIDLLSPRHYFIDKILGDYQIDRLMLFIYPDPKNPKYAQTWQSIQAIGSGQFSGKGLYNGTLNRLNYLYESHNDFVFSVIGEEFGFVGCVSVLAAMLVLIGLCIYVANRAVDFQGRMIAACVAGMLCFQTIANVGVAQGILPNTGMSLPFISSGGSSMWINMIAIGLVINVSLFKQKSFFD